VGEQSDVRDRHRKRCPFATIGRLEATSLKNQPNRERGDERASTIKKDRTKGDGKTEGAYQQENIGDPSSFLKERSRQ